MAHRKIILCLFWLVTILPCAFCIFAGAILTKTGDAIANAYQDVHVWANPGKYKTRL